MTSVLTRRHSPVGGLWVEEAFRKSGITVQPSELPKSSLYAELLPLVNAGRVELPDDKKFHAQLLGLERRTGNRPVSDRAGRGGAHRQDQAGGLTPSINCGARSAVNCMLLFAADLLFVFLLL